MNFKKPFKGKAVVLDRSNIDTDQILPKQFMKKSGRSGFSGDLFYNWKFLANGKTNSDFELNKPQNKGADILVAGENFGFGSSREHAVWALSDSGFKVIITPGFAGIFLQNCVLNGLLPATLNNSDYKKFVKNLTSDPESNVIADLENETLISPGAETFSFFIEPFHKKLLLQSGDHISWTLNYEEEIEAFEARQKKICPWLWDFADQHESLPPSLHGKIQ